MTDRMDGIRELSWLDKRLRILRYRWVRDVLRAPTITTSTRFFDLQFEAVTKDRHGRVLTKQGGHEQPMTLALLEVLRTRPGRIVLDIGANLGWFSCVVAKAFPDVEVHAFEPDPTTHGLLRGNVLLNGLGNVAIVQAAVSSAPGTARFYQFTGGNRGQNSLLPTYESESTVVEVQTLVLDDYLAQLGLADETIRFLKIDVEGHEHEALKGAAAALRRTQVVLLEYSPKFFEKVGSRGEELLDQLYVAGLQAHRVVQGRLSAVSREALLQVKTVANLMWLR
jgi:FkbM family methyltransferase